VQRGDVAATRRITAQMTTNNQVQNKLASAKGMSVCAS
jgi:hypothetical protein